MSIPVPPLRILFNTILHFSDNLAYPPNTPWHSRHIYQRDWLSPKSPFYTIQSGWIVSPVSSLSIVLADNDPNWENAPTINPITNLTSNRPTFSTHSQNSIRVIILMSSWLTYLVNLQIHLMLIRPPVSILILEKLKPISLTLSAVPSLTSSIISYSNVISIFMPTLHNLTQTLQKSTLQ